MPYTENRPKPKPSQITERALAKTHTWLTEKALTLSDEKRKREWAQIGGEAERVIQKQLKKAQDILYQKTLNTSPEAVLTFNNGNTSPHSEPALVGRCSWLLASSGVGTDKSLKAWKAYFKAYLLWASEHNALNRIRSTAGTSLTSIGASSEAYRLLGGRTHFRWISDALLTTIGDWVDQHYPKDYPEFGSQSMHAVISSVSDYLDSGSISTQKLNATLRQKLTFNPTRVDKSALFKRALSHDPDIYPLVEIAGSSYVANVDVWSRGREVAVLAAIRSSLPAGSLGILFERIVEEAFTRFSPQKTNVWAGQNMTDPARPGRHHELDVVVKSGSMLVLVECKGYIEARTADGVSSSYTSQLLHSCTQLAKRMESWSTGGRFSPELPLNGDETPFALSVPLHDFGGAGYRGDILEAAQATATIITPIQSLVLALSCMSNASELERYLSIRQWLVSKQWAILDEIEPLLLSMTPKAFEQQKKDFAERKKVRLSLMPYELPLAFRDSSSVPTNARAWSQEIYRQSKPLWA